MALDLVHCSATATSIFFVALEIADDDSIVPGSRTPSRALFLLPRSWNDGLERRRLASGAQFDSYLCAVMALAIWG